MYILQCIYNNVPSCHKHIMMYQPCRNRTTGTTNYNLKDRGIYLLDFFALIHFFFFNQ